MAIRHPSETLIEETQPVVFFDGSCPLCCREIAHYRRIDRAKRLHWLDASNKPEELAGYGLDLQSAMTELHVLDGSGQWHRGVDAFMVIWDHLPAYRWLARLVSTTGLRTPLSVGYRHFAAWRYRRRCGTGSCATTPHTQ